MKKPPVVDPELDDLYFTHGEEVHFGDLLTDMDSCKNVLDLLCSKDDQNIALGITLLSTVDLCKDPEVFKETIIRYYSEFSFPVRDVVYRHILLFKWNLKGFLHHPREMGQGTNYVLNFGYQSDLEVAASRINKIVPVDKEAIKLRILNKVIDYNKELEEVWSHKALRDFQKFASQCHSFGIKLTKEQLKRATDYYITQ